jgi:hypothetical protein
MTSVRLGDVTDDDPYPVARACAKLGWRVLPLAPLTGLPAIKKWQVDATTDVEVIDEWWSWSFPKAGVGIATGSESGIWALDLDVKNGLNGPASLIELQGRHGRVPATWTVRSRSGGLHLYFAWSDAGIVRNSTSEVGPGIDVRGEGGYVRGPRRADDVRLAVLPVPAPDWLLQRALNARRTRDRGRSRAGNFYAGLTTAEVLESAERRLSSVGSGGRNDALNAQVYYLASGSHITGVTRDEVYEIAERACRENGVWDDDGPEQFNATFAGAWSSGLAARE